MANFSDFLQALGFSDPDSPNGYVKQNWPDETGIRGLHVVRPETFYTPSGMKPPPHGRGPTIGEDIGGAPSIYQLMPFLSLLRERSGR